MIARAPSFERTEPGTRWPSGDCVELAVLRVDIETIATRLRSEVLGGFEPGMGHWHALGLRILPDTVVELLRYEGDAASTTTLRVDRGADLDNALRDVLALLGLNEESVIWRRPGS